MVGQMIRTSIQGTKAGVFRVANEEYDVIERLSDKLGLKVDIVDARSRFLEKLEGVEDPEEKRKIFHFFYQLFTLRLYSVCSCLIKRLPFSYIFFDLTFGKLMEFHLCNN